MLIDLGCLCVCCLLCGVVLFVVCCSLCVVCRLLFVGWLLCVVFVWSLFNVRCLLRVVCCVSVGLLFDCNV